MTKIPTPLGESQNIATSLARVREGLSKAARAVGRSAEGVTLIAVSKTHGVEAVRAAIAANQRHFGENRVQEAEEKFPILKAAHPDVVLHLIGPLQTNKAKEAVSLFDVIHTLDRPKLAEKLKDEMAKQNRHLPCFVQVNTGREPQKAGIAIEDLGAFVALCRDQYKLPVVGLMCIPPVADEPSPHFAFLRKLAQEQRLSQLSMGMSSDAELAVRLGATHVRVGSSIFGQRNQGQESISES